MSLLSRQSCADFKSSLATASFNSKSAFKVASRLLRSSDMGCPFALARCVRYAADDDAVGASVVELHLHDVLASDNSKAVVFDLVQPPGPSGRLRGWARQARLTEVGKGAQTLQHGRHKCSTPRPESSRAANVLLG